MQSNNFEEFLEKLQSNYEVKQGKYLAVRAKTAKDFIRLKSLGADYCEQVLRNRIIEKLNFEKGLDRKIQTAKSKNFSIIVFKTVRQYTKVFGQNLLPIKRKNPQKYFSWTNDCELEKIFDLNRKLGGGAVTLESLRFKFENLEKNLADKDSEISKLKEEINFFKELYVTAENAFNGSNSNTNSELLKQYSLTKENYLGLKKLIIEDTLKFSELEKSADTLRENLKEISDKLTTAEQILGGVYVQNLIKEETERRKAEVQEGRK
jgi:phosphoribosylformylglycinamidine (FGAM) synthase PurS component